MARAWKPDSRAWSVAPKWGQAEALARQAGVTPLVAQLLHNRGIDDPAAARSFLRPTMAELHDPELLVGAVKAAEIVARAAATGKRIVVYGDYDVDGITGASILLTCIRQAGGQADFYVPHRVEEGYGVNADAMQKIIDDGAKLLVTVDCGISAVEPVAQARAAGLEVVVTDHHGLPETLPDADAIVHPSLPGEAGKPAYPNPDLAGAGVAFKLAWQVARTICGRRKVDDAWRDFLLDATCLAALGTIADVVPLVGENRVLAAFGLRGLPSSKHVGIKALLESAGLTGENLDAYHVGFVLAPRLNACGRMGHAREAIELFTDADPARAASIAEELARKNTERQKVERAITEQAVEMVESQNLAGEQHRAIVLAGADWHSGVIGIVASRLVDRYHRPTILIAINGGLAQGSGRSIPGFNMRDAMASCAGRLTSFGGHAMAGGLRIEPGQIEAFRSEFLAVAAERIGAAQMKRHLHIDAEARISEMTLPLASQLAKFAPFGQGNPAPLLAFRGCRVLSPPRRMGAEGRTIGLTVQQGQTVMRAVGFGMGELANAMEGIGQIDLAASPSVNSFNGMTNVELQLRDVTW